MLNEAHLRSFLDKKNISEKNSSLLYLGEIWCLNYRRALMRKIIYFRRFQHKISKKNLIVHTSLQEDHKQWKNQMSNSLILMVQVPLNISNTRDAFHWAALVIEKYVSADVRCFLRIEESRFWFDSDFR